MRPIEYKPERFALCDCIPNIDNTLNIMECPHCNYRIPIMEEYTDYKLLYDKQKKDINKIMNSFDNFLTRMGDECIDAKIWMEIEKSKLENEIKSLFNKK